MKKRQKLILYESWALGRWGPWAVAPPALPQGRAWVHLRPSIDSSSIWRLISFRGLFPLPFSCDDGLCNKNNQFYYHWSSFTTTTNAILAPHVVKRTSLVIFLKPIINYVFFIPKTLFTSKTPYEGSVFFFLNVTPPLIR